MAGSNRHMHAGRLGALYWRFGFGGWLPNLGNEQNDQSQVSMFLVLQKSYS